MSEYSIRGMDSWKTMAPEDEGLPEEPPVNHDAWAALAIARYEKARLQRAIRRTVSAGRTHQLPRLRGLLAAAMEAMDRAIEQLEER